MLRIGAGRSILTTSAKRTLNVKPMKQAFLSYAHVDIRKVRRLYRDLRRRIPFRIWFDRINILSGVKYKPAIRKAIRESDYFLAVLSGRAVSGKGFRDIEMREALAVVKEFPEDRIFIIPTRLDKCQMPFRKLEEFSYADMFPQWRDGIRQLCRTLRSETPGRGGLRTQLPTPRPLFHYEIALADLELGIPNLARVARAFNNLQSVFHFSLKQFPVPRQALTTIEHEAQFYVDRLPKSFYKKVVTLETDRVICLTRRLLAFNENDKIVYNYLAGHSLVDERVRFISSAGLAEHAQDADVSLDVAIAYLLTADMAVYFMDLEYHRKTRHCPMDFTEYHSDLVGGLRKGRFCNFCSRRLRKNRSFERAFKAMLAWGRR